ncbi:MAG: DUF4037 domain-containing protein [Lachnospiraceae bacterium]|nr:DUF4037 domain-containing protein [Lachnospiraceae bacterium]
MDKRFESSRRFYEAEVAPMIHEKFREAEDRIAVGIAGEGSDCFGYDDLISRDHDFGTGVCLWLTGEDMQAFGRELSDAYAALVDSHGGDGLTERLRERRGVMSINDFYSNVLGTDLNVEKLCDILGLNRRKEVPDGGSDIKMELTVEFWNDLDNSCLATAVNGEVFRDDLRLFSSFREFLLDYYPEDVWRIRIAEELHSFSAALQVNYARCMTRGDVVAASVCRLKGIESAMQLFFLMKREYPPYYKWTYRRLTEIDREGAFSALLRDLSLRSCNMGAWEDRPYNPDKLNTDDETVVITEKIASHIVSMLGQRGFIRSVDPYLETHVNEVLKSKDMY